jgi:hypothetical protein
MASEGAAQCGGPRTSANYSRLNQLPLVTVAAVLVLVASIIPVYLGSRLTADPGAVPWCEDLNAGSPFETV